MHRRIYTVTWIAISALSLSALYVIAHRLMSDEDPAQKRILTYELVIGAPDSDSPSRVFRAVQGDRVLFRIRSDCAGQFSVHGIEQSVHVAPDREARLSFQVASPGVYPLHLHESMRLEDGREETIHRQLATLEVQSR